MKEKRKVSSSLPYDTVASPQPLGLLLPIAQVVPKDAATMMALQKSVSGNVLFAHLEKDELSDVLDAMFLVIKHPGDVIIQQGDDGDNFYIIDEGIVEVGAQDMCYIIIVEHGNVFAIT